MIGEMSTLISVAAVLVGGSLPPAYGCLQDSDQLNMARSQDASMNRLVAQRSGRPKVQSITVAVTLGFPRS